MRTKVTICAYLFVLIAISSTIRAETDMYFGMFVKRGGLGKFYHFRELPPVDDPGVRPNRDTLYSQEDIDTIKPALVYEVPRKA